MTDRAPTLRPVDFDPFAPFEAAPFDLPLTGPQREMWAAAAMSDEASCSYNQCFVLTLAGPVHAESLGRALDGVVRRHDGLRTEIARDGSAQTIRPPFHVTLEIVDLTGLGRSEREAEIARRGQEECTTAFDLEQGPLLRASLLRLEDDLSALVLTVHHIVCDGWSSAVLFSDLGGLYRADRVGIEAALPEPASYASYVTEATTADAGAEEAAAIDYWVAQYADGVPVLDLPTRGQRPRSRTFPCGRRLLEVDADLHRGLRAAGAKAGATLFVTLLATFELLVERISSQEQFVVGVPFADQPRLANGHLIGHCVHTVPLRAELDPDATVADHLRTVRNAVSAAQDHARTTFGDLLSALQVRRDPSRTPLVPVTFSIDKVGAPFDFGEVTVAGVATPRAYANFELQVNVVDDGSTLLVECDYNTDLFDEATVGGWLELYHALLRSVAESPEAPLEGLAGVAVPAAAASSRERLPATGTLHARFEQRALATPDRVAVTCDGDTVSYRHLDRRANGLAAALHAAGVAPGDLVGLRLDRTPALVVGVLGILKAGAAYVPLDPAYPLERTRFMIEDSGVRVVVSDGAGADLGDVRVVRVDLAEPLDAAPAVDVGADDPAYVIYTSGSTGRPKGVVVTHYNVTRLFDATEHWFGFDEDDVWTLFHSYAFDFSVWELWGALLHGGRLVVVPYLVSRDPGAFRELLLRESVTVLNQTPSAFAQLVRADVEAGTLVPTRLRHVVFGGERLDFATLRPWFERHGDEAPRLVNMYGITETTVHVTYRPVTLADVESPRGSLIGVPIPDLSLELLDARGRPVPPGVPGEIHVGGAGVARGYLNRPELTAERFLPDPHEPGALVYRTGDLARRHDDGELEYLGRIDNQVKIRGFRIELGEIEAAMREHDGVVDCVALVRAGDAGPRIVAWIVGAGATLAADVRAHLRARLPEYMVPAAVVRLDSLPLTANGKVDHDALPVDEAHPAPSQLTAPRTPTEASVARIFAESVGRDAVGADESFFDVGGDSLKAVSVIREVGEMFAVDVAMRHLFEEPTVAGLARTVDLLALTDRARPVEAGVEREEIEL